VVLGETAADAVAAQVDTAEDRLVEATTCSEADFLLGAVSDFVAATFERPSWSCSMKYRATATRSSKS
jgi:hypothetical protein